MSEGVPFGNYRLLRRLARGGMAEVFLARQQGVEGFERRVAIKRILPHLSDSAEFRTMFLDEARLAAQLSHPNIIHIYDFGKVDDYYFIAMEYVDGVDMGRLIKLARQTPIPFEMLARIMADICAGLHYAHNISDGAGKRLDVVHRDVTPQNVLVTYDGIVKVVDFGIAKATWQASRTRPGVVKGKYAYMSPEQVEGRALDARSDIYSVAICLYELMTGQPLYRRDNVTEAMKEIRDGKPVHPEQHRADIPPELMAVLKKALSTSRGGRYVTAAAMQLDLERYLKGAAALATPQLLGEFLRRETPPGPPGEALIAGPDGEPIAAPKGAAAAPTPMPAPAPAAPAPPDGTAPLSSVKDAVAPAYDINPASLPSTQVEDATRPGKLVRGNAVGFENPVDDELTRKDDREPILTAAEQSLSISVEMPASTGGVPPTVSDQQSQKSGASLQGSPLGALSSGSQQQAPLLSQGTGDTPTSALIKNPERGRIFVWLAFLVLLVGGSVLGAQRLGLLNRHRGVAPVTVLPTVTDAAIASTHSDLSVAKPGEQKPITTALPVQTSATIGVYTRPSGAQVFIDGERLEMLTPVRTQPITEGPHHIVIERSGYTPREIDVVMKPGETRRLEFELPQEASLQPHGKHHGGGSNNGGGGWSRVTGNGSLTTATVPPSRVFEGSRLLGETPIVNVPLPEGSHTLTFQAPDHEPVKKKVVIHVGEETKLKFSFEEP